MLNTSIIKNALLIVIVSAVILACKKKEETPEPDPIVPAPACFNSSNNGTYIGSGSTLTSPFTSGTLTVSRTSCNEVALNLITNTSANINENVSQLVLNSGGAYDGKLANNNNISLSFGSVLTVNAIGSFTLNGAIKQP